MEGVYVRIAAYILVRKSLIFLTVANLRSHINCSSIESVKHVVNINS